MVRLPSELVTRRAKSLFRNFSTPILSLHYVGKNWDVEKRLRRYSKHNRLGGMRQKVSNVRRVRHQPLRSGPHAGGHQTSERVIPAKRTQVLLAQRFIMNPPVFFSRPRQICICESHLSGHVYGSKASSLSTLARVAILGTASQHHPSLKTHTHLLLLTARTTNPLKTQPPISRL